MTGDTQDILSRLKALLPNGWFGEPTPILDAVLAGIASALAAACSLTSHARLQTRISTATGGFLDLISFDFFGTDLPRQAQESDPAFRARILADLFPERATRRGMILALQALTGRTPRVFEPARPADTGGYNTGGLAYNAAGGYGSLRLPFQAFVVAYRPLGQGIPNIAGYGNPQGAYNTGSRIEYGSLGLIENAVTDAAIYAAADGVKPAGTTVWVHISS